MFEWHPMLHFLIVGYLFHLHLLPSLPQFKHHTFSALSSCHTVLQCNNNNNTWTFVLHLKLQSKLAGAGHCTSAGCMTGVLWDIAEAFPPARQRTILNNHRVMGIATNTSMALSCALAANLIMTAQAGLPDAV